MLEIVNYNRDEYEFPCLLVLGCFDSIHVGHAELLKKAKLQAKINGLDLGVMTFTDGKDDGKQVFTFDERLAIFEQFGVKFVLKADYNDELKQTAPMDFLHNLEEKLNIKAYMSGKDFHFGAGAKGKVSTLKKYAEDEDNGVWFMPVKDVEMDDVKVGTALIKHLLQEGDVKKAAEELGRRFFISGIVEKGHERGTDLGYPTVNIHYPDDKVAVKQGVYSAVCTVNGADYEAVLSFGGRPTFGEDEPVLEVHLINFDGDIYGENVTVHFVEYLRDIEKFDSPEALSEQIKTDIANAENDVAEEQPAEEEALTEPAAKVASVQPAEEPVEVQPEEVMREEAAPEDEPTAESDTEEVITKPVEEPAEEEATTEPAETEPDTEEDEK